MQASAEPQGSLALRTVAMPADTNPNGHIFGGWVVSQMDLAGMMIVRQCTPHKVVTVAIEAMEFIKPIEVGDFVCCYAEVIKTGRTSMTVKIQTWAVRTQQTERHQVTEGVFVYVAVDDNQQPVPITS